MSPRLCLEGEDRLRPPHAPTSDGHGNLYQETGVLEKNDSLKPQRLVVELDHTVLLPIHIVITVYLYLANYGIYYYCEYLTVTALGS